MTLTFLELYNTAASQEWSMYDNDAKTNNDFEKSLVIDLNKAVTEILYSYPFSFREKTHIIFTMPRVKSYKLPRGLILKDNKNNYCVKVNSNSLKLIKNPLFLEEKQGYPEGFYIKNSNIVLYPTPNEKYIITVDYIMLAIGENNNGDEIFTLQNADDIIYIPEHLEEIFKNAVISRTMLNSISAEKDENFSAYKKQSEIAYRQLVKYAKGIQQDKIIKI
jgi:hypothetical protein